MPSTTYPMNMQQSVLASDPIIINSATFLDLAISGDHDTVSPMSPSCELNVSTRIYTGVLPKSAALWIMQQQLSEMPTHLSLSTDCLA